ncbi:cell wall hydrolase [Clostridium tertium]|uniref:Spore cortex-lytic enzyme n=1 Tax=Clostridium tertium TaxID=1559 RepID=A0A6N3CVI3_9CLOT
MKIFKSFILLIALLLSANTVTYASSNVTNLKNNILKEKINIELINMYDNDVVEVFNHNDSLVYLTEEDLKLMAEIVYAESKGEPYEGKVAVASVILNRVLSPGFPNTIQEVILQPNAFSCVVNGEINVTPTEECYSAVYDAIKGNDPTNEALFFYNPSIATCSWMQDVQKTNSKTIGQHLFFNTY